jgi:hypothetical protein
MYKDLIRFQVHKERVEAQEKAMTVPRPEHASSQQQSLSEFEASLLKTRTGGGQHAKTVASLVPGEDMKDFSLPVRGRPFYLNDRERYHLDR